MSDRYIEIDPETNLTMVRYRAKHSEESIIKRSDTEEPTKKEKIEQLLVTNKNMPNPGALSISMNQGNHEPIEPTEPGKKIVFDEKGHPINPSNQARYWKMVRKARRLNSKR